MPRFHMVAAEARTAIPFALSPGNAHAPVGVFVAFIGVIHQHRHRPQAVQQFPAFWSISLVVRAGQTQKTPTVNG